MKSEERVYVNVFLSLIIVFCMIITIFLVVKRRELERSQTIHMLKSPAALPNVDVVENPDYVFSLNSVINGYQFSNDYNLDIEYRDMSFSFVCTSFMNNSCVSGSASFIFNDRVYSLFDYVGNSNNYLIHPYDLIIIKNGDNIGILRDNILMLYDEFGNTIRVVDNVIIRYRDGESNFDKNYPKYVGDELEYYACEKNQVVFYKTYVSNETIIEAKNLDNTYCITV